MWKTLSQLPALLIRIANLLEEQNALLRELHLRTTGHHAQTPSRRGIGTSVTTNPNTGEGPRRKSASDVWRSTPKTASDLFREEQQRREATASQPSDDTVTQ